MIPTEHIVPLATELTSAWWIAVVAFTSPILAALSHKKVPDVVWMLVLGMVIGPSILAKASLTPGIEFIRELGLGLLFFMAGLEIDQEDVRSADGRRAGRTWVICLLLGIGAIYLFSDGNFDRAVVLGIAATSTALGALLPILKDGNYMDSPIGKAAMRHGAIGELGPIMAMTLLLSTRAPWQSALVLLAFFALSVITVAIPRRAFAQIKWLRKVMVRGMNTTQQTVLRLAILILFSLMLLSVLLDLDVVLGAFMAGMLLGRIIPEKPLHAFVARIEVVGFSFLIPVFFVTSGMNIDAKVVAGSFQQVLLFMLVIFTVRGLPVVIREYGFSRRLLTQAIPSLKAIVPQTALTCIKDRLALGFYAATGLPIIVAVAEVATTTKIITQDYASIMVAAGALTVLIFPFIAGLLQNHQQPTESR